MAAVLAATAVTVGLSVYAAGSIQARLAQQARSALAATGLDADVSLHGRDAVVTTHSSSGSTTGEAAAVVAAVPGIRVVHAVTSVQGAAPGPTVAVPTPTPSTTPTPTPTPSRPAPTDDPAAAVTDHPAVFHFGIGQVRLGGTAKARLRDLAQFLRDHPQVHVRVQGHADGVGTAESNLGLSRRRALTVIRLLTAAGVEPDRLTAEAYGSSRPIRDDSSPDGRAANRRVELLFEGAG